MDSVKMREAVEAGKTILGIEFGSTRIKAVLTNDENTPIAQGAHDWENRLENGIWTYTLEDIWSGLQDAYAKLKYDATSDKDAKVIARVCEIADVHGVSMTEVSLAWLLTKVSSPVVGATKISHVEGAAKAVELKLSDDEINALEELYEPHFLSGVMAQNTPAARNIEQVWIKNGKYRK